MIQTASRFLRAGKGPARSSAKHALDCSTNQHYITQKSYTTSNFAIISRCQMVMRVDKLDIKANRKNRALVDALFVVVTFIPKPDPDGRDQAPPQKEAVDGSKEAAKTSAKEKKK